MGIERLLDQTSVKGSKNKNYSNIFFFLQEFLCQIRNVVVILKHVKSLKLDFIKSVHCFYQHPYDQRPLRTKKMHQYTHFTQDARYFFTSVNATDFVFHGRLYFLNKQNNAIIQIVAVTAYAFCKCFPGLLFSEWVSLIVFVFCRRCTY